MLQISVTMLQCSITMLQCSITMLQCSITMLQCSITVLQCSITTLQCSITMLQWYQLASHFVLCDLTSQNFNTKDCELMRVYKSLSEKLVINSLLVASTYHL